MCDYSVKHFNPHVKSWDWALTGQYEEENKGTSRRDGQISESHFIDTPSPDLCPKTLHAIVKK